MPTRRHDALPISKTVLGSRNNQFVPVFTLLLLVLIAQLFVLPKAQIVQAADEPVTPSNAADGSTNTGAVVTGLGISSPGAIFLPMARSAGRTTQTNPSGSTKIVQGLFYDRPGNASVSEVASKAGVVVLTRGNWRYRDELRAAGFKGVALQYLNSSEAAGPGPYANSSVACDSNYSPPNNTVANQQGDFCKYIHPNESWFLHNGRGERLYTRLGNGVRYHMNPASEGWRNFARSRMARDLIGDSSQAKIGFDGLYLDNLPMKLYKLQNQLSNSDGRVQEYGDDSVFRSAVLGYVGFIGDKLRPAGPLYANLIDDWAVSVNDYLAYTSKLDGYLNEAWALGYENRELSAARWNEYMSIAETTLGQGKGLIGVVQGSRYDSKRQQFGLASYLLITNNSKAFFRYADASQYGDWWQYSNYSITLGAPKGKRYQQGSLWRRDFECGYVTADPGTRTGNIVRTCN